MEAVLVDTPDVQDIDHNLRASTFNALLRMTYPTNPRRRGVLVKPQPPRSSGEVFNMDPEEWKKGGLNDDQVNIATRAITRMREKLVDMQVSNPHPNT